MTTVPLVRTRRGLRTVDVGGLAIWALAAVCLVALVWPVAALAIGAFHDTAPGDPPNWGTAAFGRAFDSPNFVASLRNTIVFTALVVPLGLIVGLTLALIGASSNARLRTLIGPTVVVAYAMPPLFYSIGYALAGSGRAGVLNDLLRTVAGLDPLVNATSWPGLIFVSVLRAGAFSYILLVGPVRALSRSQNEAVLAAGGHPFLQQLRMSILPSLRPALVGVVILAVISHIGLFDAIYILGNSSGITTASVLSYRFLQTDGTPDFAAASVTGLLILVLAALLVIVQQRRLNVRAAVTVSGKPERPLLIEFSRFPRLLIDVVILVYVVVFLIVPVGSIVLTSFQRFPGLYSDLSTKFYQDIFSTPEAMQSLLTSLVLGVVGAGLGIALALAVVAARITRARSAATMIVVASAMAPVALSGVVGSIGYIWAVVLLEPTKPLYGSMGLLVIALAAGVVPTAVLLLTGSVAQIDLGLLAAARASGDSWIRAFVTVVIPVIAPSFANTWFLSFITVVGALDVTLVLSGPGSQPAATFVYRAYANAGFGEATAMLVLMLLGLVALRLLLQLVVWALRPDLRPRRKVA